MFTHVNEPVEAVITQNIPTNVCTGENAKMPTGSLTAAKIYPCDLREDEREFIREMLKKEPGPLQTDDAIRLSE